MAIGDLRSTGCDGLGADLSRELLDGYFSIAMHEDAERFAALGLEDQGLDHGVLGDAERHARGAGAAVRLPRVEVRHERDDGGSQRANRHRDGVLGHGRDDKARLPVRMQAHDLSEHVHHEDEDDHNRSGERRTRWVVVITTVMMFGELIVGWWTGSVALTADGWHMGTHVGALGLTLVAYWYARTRAGHDAFSFGTGKVYALAGYTSGVVLALVAIWMAKEGVEHLIEHPPVDYRDALPVAAVGLVVNIVSAVLLSRGHHYGHGHGHGHGHHHGGHDHGDHDHGGHDGDRHVPKPGTLDFNLRAAYIHIIADALTSLLAIGALSLGWWAGLWFLDPLMGLVGGAVITWWAVSLCLAGMPPAPRCRVVAASRTDRPPAPRGHRRCPRRRPPCLGARAGPA